MSVQAQPERSSGLLWDVLDEHLDEAVFRLEQFDAASESSVLTLAELSRHPESSLLAHVDALLIAGSPFREQALEKVLDEGDPEVPAATAVAALVCACSGDYKALLSGLANTVPELAMAAARGGALGGGARMDHWLTEQLAGEHHPDARAGLLELACQRGVEPPNLMDALQSPDERLVAAAARAARYGSSELYLGIQEDLLNHQSSAVRDAALLAVLAWGSRRGMRVCEERAGSTERVDAFAMNLLAATGGRPQHQALVRCSERDQARKAGLFALGFSGDVEVLDDLLPHLSSRDPLVAKIAMQSIGNITGIDITSDAYLIPIDQTQTKAPATDDEQELVPLDDDLQDDLAEPPESELGIPDVEALTKAVAQWRSGAGVEQRVVSGLPYSVRSVAEHLGRAPLRVRHVLALGLGIHSGGQVWINTRVFSRRQRAQLGNAIHSTLQLRNVVAW